MSAVRPAKAQPSCFQRLLLPALAFKAVVIGGGYATGRELAEFFLPSGARGGLLGMLLAALVWSVVGAVTFLLARATHSGDYQTFFRKLLGRFAVSFEMAYCLLVVLVLAVFGAAAGAIGQAVFSAPTLAGALFLLALIGAFVSYGNTAVEQLFKYVSILLYATYAVFLVLCLSRFGSRISASLAQPLLPGEGWISGGLTYAGYNIIGAVVILPVARHFTSRRDAVIAGLICGPLAMLPAALFFICMTAYSPDISHAMLPSDVLLQRLDLPTFHLIFQLMIFAALLESGTGLVNAIIERIAQAWHVRRSTALPLFARVCITAGLLAAANFLAGRYGLIELIARGFRALGWIFLGIYVLPLLTLGVWRLTRADLAGRAGVTAG
jgi:uncharacterized membrane protein YkvI